MKALPTSIQTPAVLEAIRREHCAHESGGDPAHGCAGEVTITATGVKLACTLCGPDEEDHVDPKSWGAVLARGVLEAAGVEWDALCATRQIRAMQACGFLACPGCKREHRPDPAKRYEDLRCECGWIWESWRRSWRRGS
jgi:hypothetical protein